MSRILITGAAGFIGSHLISILGTRHEVFALVRHTPTNIENHGIHWIEQDLGQPLDLTRIPKQPDAVIHLAQSGYYRKFPERAKDIFEVNIQSTFRLLDYAWKAKVRTFILASSGGIYGHGEGFREDQPISAKDDLGFYLGTKLCAEVMSENYSSFMNILILRFFFVYGPGQRTTMLIPRLVESIKEERPIILQGREGLKINPTYVTDAAYAVFRSLELLESQKINIAGPEVLSLRQIGQEIGEVLNREPIFEVQENGRSQDLVGDIKKMTHFLGPPTVRFREGIKKYIEGQNDK